MQQKQIQKIQQSHTSKFAKKVELANLKSNVNKVDIDKLKNVPTNLSHLKNKVDN